MRKAPWTDIEVEALQLRQDDSSFHPYTCECGCLLIPTNHGWVCKECSYKQDWCHNLDLVPLAQWEKKEEPHPMLCFQHGGSEACEAVNKEHGFTCPKCHDHYYLLFDWGQRASTRSWRVQRVAYDLSVSSELIKFIEEMEKEYPKFMLVFWKKLSGSVPVPAEQCIAQDLIPQEQYLAESEKQDMLWYQNSLEVLSPLRYHLGILMECHQNIERDDVVSFYISRTKVEEMLKAVDICEKHFTKKDSDCHSRFLERWKKKKGC